MESKPGPIEDGPEIPDAPQGAPDLQALPMVGLEVIRRALDPRCSVTDLESIIRTDVALTQRLLRVANSAYYRRTYPAQTVREAVIHLGLNELRRVAVTTSVLDFMTSGAAEGFDREGFFLHCLTVGALSQELSSVLGFEDPPIAFVAGLLHDVGKTFFDQHYPEPFGRSLALAQAQEIPLFAAEREVFSKDVHPTLRDHTAMGRWALKAWNLPEAFCEVAGRHHAGPGENSSFLVDVVRSADAIAQNLPVGSSGNGCQPDWLGSTIALGLAPEDLVGAVQNAVETAARMGEVGGIAFERGGPDEFLERLASMTWAPSARLETRGLGHG